ncbi:cyanamide hydratase family HD domain-containing protein [Lepidopterella palustris CBS 459.81]|uniref:Cyanamide hydratase family HD domain-containing protein n=1 Tax=Lepidopterella palustris CBS 459.81 TaxID=1314670 RepID=A0A8E2JDT3_9PEZI|nr:cyanamide hydratase family HD domain-containing protein [Lepidopterella palustris CBS 459.81]
MSNLLEAYGWTPVPRSQSKLLGSIDSKPAAKISTSDVTLPSSQLAQKVFEYAKAQLPEQTFNHSMRVFYYGSALIKQHLPHFAPSTETYYLTCLLHDIGTTTTNLHATRMSFEFHGGLLALELLKSYGAPQEQAESVAEAIIRHQDLGESGMITTVGQLIQLTTVFDNMGINPSLIHKDTIDSVTKAYPRNKWSSCFAATIREEVGLKPWCHTTAIDGFAEGVEGNKLMEPWE